MGRWAKEPMDYYEITERYKKREFRKQFSWLIRIIVLCLVFWLGWFLGNSQQDDRVSDVNHRITELHQEKDQLAQELASITNALRVEEKKRLAAELINEQSADGGVMRRLKAMIAEYLARGVEEDQLRLALQSASKPSRCRLLEAQDLAVATGFFAGNESNTGLLDGAVRVFVEGEAHREATKDRPWFDPEKPVSMRVSYLEGEKIGQGHLPFKVNLLADRWILQLALEQIALRGYVKVSISKCNID